LIAVPKPHETVEKLARSNGTSLERILWPAFRIVLFFRFRFCATLLLPLIASRAV
jgi:hypothetical protein